MRGKKILKGILIAIAILIVTVLLLVAPIDRTPLRQQPFYKGMMTALDSIELNRVNQAKLFASWAKVNITPPYQMPMAGYKPRDHFDSVNDSLSARIIILQSGTARAAIINIDLLIFPPTLKAAIVKKLNESGNVTFLYLAATHTHNGIGGWDDSILGKVAAGDFHPEWIDAIATTIADSIMSMKPVESSVSYWERDASEFVVNRIAYSKGKTDGKLRGIQIKRADSTQAMLFTFSAHPTSITKKSLSLSADYPSSTIRLLEQEFDFGMFMGGMVGSHSFAPLEEQNFKLVNKEGQLLYEKIQSPKIDGSYDSVTIAFAHIPIQFGPSQLRISDNWKVRNWVLESLFGGLTGELTYLRVGNIVMIGTPCDFSGEIFTRDKLDSLAAHYNKHLVITSFNGNYTGYITYDGHYDSIKNAETRELNWVGPYYGEYFSTMIKKLIEKDPVTFER